MHAPVNDTLRDAGIAVLGFALFSGLMQQRAQHAVAHDLSRTLHGAPIHVRVAPSGLLGVLFARSSVTTITGRGLTADELPFRATPGGGARIHVRRLLVDLQDMTLRGQPMRRFEADVPNVDLDLARAMLDERIVVRSAGEGTASGVIDANDLRTFITRKYPQLSDVEVRLSPGAAFLRGTAALLGGRSVVEATAKIAVVDSLRLNLVDAVMTVNGKPPTPGFAAVVLGAINPILDIDKDLGLRGYVQLESAEIGDGIVTLRGRATIPRK